MVPKFYKYCPVKDSCNSCAGLTLSLVATFEAVITPTIKDNNPYYYYYTSPLLRHVLLHLQQLAQVCDATMINSSNKGRLKKKSLHMRQQVLNYKNQININLVKG